MEACVGEYTRLPCNTGSGCFALPSPRGGSMLHSSIAGEVQELESTSSLKLKATSGPAVRLDGAMDPILTVRFALSAGGTPSGASQAGACCSTLTMFECGSGAPLTHPPRKRFQQQAPKFGNGGPLPPLTVGPCSHAGRVQGTERPEGCGDAAGCQRCASLEPSSTAQKQQEGWSWPAGTLSAHTSTPHTRAHTHTCTHTCTHTRTHTHANACAHAHAYAHAHTWTHVQATFSLVNMQDRLASTSCTLAFDDCSFLVVEERFYLCGPAGEMWCGQRS